MYEMYGGIERGLYCRVYDLYGYNSLSQWLISHKEISISCNESWSYTQVLLTFLQFKHDNSQWYIDRFKIIIKCTSCVSQCEDFSE